MARKAKREKKAAAVLAARQAKERKALELLGKHQSMFTDRTVVSGNSAELIQAEKVTDLEVARRLGFLLTRGAEPA